MITDTDLDTWQVIGANTVAQRRLISEVRRIQSANATLELRLAQCSKELRDLRAAYAEAVLDAKQTRVKALGEALETAEANFPHGAAIVLALRALARTTPGGALAADTKEEE